METWASILNKFLDNVNLGKLFSEVLPGMVLASGLLYLALAGGVLSAPETAATRGDAVLTLIGNYGVFVALLAVVLGILNSQLSGATIYAMILKIAKRVDRANTSRAKEENPVESKSVIYYLVQHPDSIPQHVSLIQDYFRYIELSMNLVIPLLFWAGVVFFSSSFSSGRFFLGGAILIIAGFLALNAYWTYLAYNQRRADFLEGLKQIHENVPKTI